MTSNFFGLWENVQTFSTGDLLHTSCHLRRMNINEVDDRPFLHHLLLQHLVQPVVHECIYVSPKVIR